MNTFLRRRRGTLQEYMLEEQVAGGWAHEPAMPTLKEAEMELAAQVWENVGNVCGKVWGRADALK